MRVVQSVRELMRYFEQGLILLDGEYNRQSCESELELVSVSLFELKTVFGYIVNGMVVSRRIRLFWDDYLVTEIEYSIQEHNNKIQK